LINPQRAACCAKATSAYYTTSCLFNRNPKVFKNLTGSANSVQHEFCVGGGMFQPRSRGFPRSGFGPPFTAGSGLRQSTEPRSRGFSVFGFSPRCAVAQAAE